MRRPSKPRTLRGAGWVRVFLSDADDLAFWGAAYQLTGLAHAVIGGDKSACSVTLRPVRGTSVSGLAETFLKAYEDQRARWSVARGNLDLRAMVLSRALELSQAEDGGDAIRTPSLSAGQKAEIAAMLAEAERAPIDPLGIAKPWDEGS